MIKKKLLGAAKFVPAFALGAALCAAGFVYAYELRTVGFVNGARIRKYDISTRLNAGVGNAVKNTARDMVFFSEMEKLGLSVTDEEVETMLETEAEKYGGITELETILLDTTGDINTYRLSIKRSLLQQKAIDYFAAQATGSDEEKQEKGREEYQKLLDEIEQTTEITVY